MQNARPSAEFAAESSSSECCAHCGSPIGTFSESTSENLGPRFCCRGCQFVYASISKNGLGEYYQIREQFISRANRAEEPSSDFSYLENKELLKEFMLAGEAHFFVSGIQCAACVWILEKIPTINSSIYDVRVDAIRKIASVKVKNPIDVQDFAKAAAGFGYKVRPIRISEKTTSHQKLEQRSELLRIGITAVCAGNIMLFATSVYLGADPKFSQLFNWLSFALVIPVMMYGASGIFSKALLSVKAKVPSLDLPVAVAIFAGFLLSFYQLLIGQEKVYFDSISVLVLLILSSRYFVNRFQEKFLNFENDEQSLLPIHANRIVARQSQIVPAVSVKIGDQVRINTGERLPTDGVVRTGAGLINEVILSGEALPRSIVPGSKVFAGTLLTDGTVDIEATEISSQSRMAKLIAESTQSAMLKSDINRDLEKWVQVFTYIVLAVGLISLAYFWVNGNVMEGIGRSLSLFIVACPCAMAFGVPIVFSKALLISAQEGMFFRSADVFRKLLNIKTVIFDKTGTLTRGNLAIASYSDSLSYETRQAVVAIESMVSHPIANALVKAFSVEILRFEQAQEVSIMPGRGVRGKVKGQEYTIQSCQAHKALAFDEAVIALEVLRDKEFIGNLYLQDQLRPEAQFVTSQLRKEGKSLWILSGDRSENVHSIAHKLDISDDLALGRCMPEEKTRIVQSLPNTLMVGDGINDAGALAVADVGVVVGGAMERALRVAEVYLTQNGISAISRMFDLARRTEVAIQRIRFFSIGYNVLTGSLAIMGYVSPLAAALLMPVSSVSVLLIAIFGVRTR